MKEKIILIIYCVASIHIASCKKEEDDSQEHKKVVDSTGTIIIDGSVYRTFKIANQWWTATNLKATHYRNGDLIPKVTDNIQWSKLSTGGRCYFADDTGKTMLYNWYVASDIRNIAPLGWHVPTKSDWDTLISHSGGDALAGGYLENKGFYTTGSRNADGGYEFPDYGDWWASTEFYSAVGNHCGHPTGKPEIYNIGFDKRYGFAIRCVKD